MLTALLMQTGMAAVLAVSDRTEVRLRSPGSVPDSTAVDVETAPALVLGVGSRSLRYALAYLPRVTRWDLGTSRSQLVLLHEGSLGARWIERRVQLSIDERFSYGGVNFATIAPAGQAGAQPRIDAVPGSQVIRHASSTTTLGSRLTFRLWSAALSVGYQLGGGATPGARAVMPFQSGPFGEVSATRAVRRTDDLVTTAAASESSFSSGPESLLLEVTEGWRHAWSRATRTGLAVGVSEARSRASAGAAHGSVTYPVAEGEFTRRVPTDRGRFDLQLGVRLGPVVNRLLGLVDQRVQGTVVVSRTFARLETHAFLRGGRSVAMDGVAAIRIVAGELGASFRVTPVVALDAGLRSLWQRQDRIELKQSSVFVGVTLRAPDLKL
jgi:hypothetical protein